MITEQDARFIRKMRIFLGLFWSGLLVIGVGLIAMFTLRPLGEHINIITAVVCTGFGAMVVAGLGRVASRCPRCNGFFCGKFEDNGGDSGSVLASSCRHCGFRANGEG